MSRNHTEIGRPKYCASYWRSFLYLGQQSFSIYLFMAKVFMSEIILIKCYFQCDCARDFPVLKSCHHSINYYDCSIEFIFQMKY